MDRYPSFTARPFESVNDPSFPETAYTRVKVTELLLVPHERMNLG